MTIDERLEKLTERHEALTLTVELITADLQTLKTLSQQDGENIQKLTERHEALTQTVELMAKMQQQDSQDIRALGRIAEQDGENIRALARIAELHEKRLTDIEGGE